MSIDFGAMTNGQIWNYLSSLDPSVSHETFIYRYNEGRRILEAREEADRRSIQSYKAKEEKEKIVKKVQRSISDLLSEKERESLCFHQVTRKSINFSYYNENGNKRVVTLTICDPTFRDTIICKNDTEEIYKKDMTNNKVWAAFDTQFLNKLSEIFYSLFKELENQPE